ncbi:MAG: PPE family protein [Mycobacterium kyogaense]|uniref:PPE family protein n=1 Tax=Mycobacterium kyogaense TaxID=2212479 RepID=UPI002FF6D066
MWLGAGVFALGASAALAGGSGVAHADTADASISHAVHHATATKTPRSASSTKRTTSRRPSPDERHDTRVLRLRSRGTHHDGGDDAGQSSPAAEKAPHTRAIRLHATDSASDEITERIEAQTAAFNEEQAALGAQKKTFADDVEEAIADRGTAPPEVNSNRWQTGVGTEALLSGAATWNGLARHLNSAAGAFDHVADNLGGSTRVGSVVSSAAESYAGWLATTAGHAENAAAQARAAAMSYESAFSAGAAPPTLSINRAELTALIAANFFSMNGPAIVATEVMYLEMLAGRVPTTQTSAPR